MSFFDEVQTTVANTQFLHAQDDDTPVVLKFSRLEILSHFEEQVRTQMSIEKVFLLPIAVYQFQRYLALDLGLKKTCEFIDAIDEFKTSKVAERINLLPDMYNKYLNPGWVPPPPPTPPPVDPKAKKAATVAPEPLPPDVWARPSTNTAAAAAAVVAASDGTGGNTAAETLSEPTDAALFGR
jgi:hypothetical protein